MDNETRLLNRFIEEVNKTYPERKAKNLLWVLNKLKATPNHNLLKFRE